MTKQEIKGLRDGDILQDLTTGLLGVTHPMRYIEWENGQCHELFDSVLLEERFVKTKVTLTRKAQLK